MKKYLFEIVIILFIIIEVCLIIFNYIDKCEIAKILGIDNTNDFSVEELKELLGYDSANPIFIKFKIRVDKYEQYNLKYEDVSLDDYIYEGEITNKKHKISDNYYMCYYEKTIYDNTEKNRFKKFKIDRMFLKLSSVILIFLIIIYAIKKISRIVIHKRNNQVEIK